VVKGDQGGPDSHGFCLLNNVSIGAAYAMHMHRDTVKRVAIVDFGELTSKHIQ
jgi:acetoin utilization deacetylase AcuC-like enzyme